MIGVALLGLAGLVTGQGGDKAASKKSAAKRSAVNEKGKEIYRINCLICHHSGSLEKKVGPGLKGIFKTGKFADGSKVDDASMKAWIEKGGKDMPPFKEILLPEQIADLIAYLKSL